MIVSSQHRYFFQCVIFQIGCGKIIIDIEACRCYVWLTPFMVKEILAMVLLLHAQIWVIHVEIAFLTISMIRIYMKLIQGLSHSVQILFIYFAMQKVYRMYV